MMRMVYDASTRANVNVSSLKIECSMSVLNLISGGKTTKQTLKIKMTATKIGEATLELNKWHSNIRHLEVQSISSDYESQRYGKRQLCSKMGESKLPGVPWEKDRGKTQVNFPTSTTEPTIRGIRGKLAKICDPLGLP